MKLSPFLSVLALSQLLAPDLMSPLYAQHQILAQPERVLADGMTWIGSIRPLSDGRVLILDMAERRVMLVDAAFRQATPVGRIGGGPGEYTRPINLIPFSGDTTFINDPGNNRLLLIDESGRTRETIELPGGGLPCTQLAVEWRRQPPLLADQRGRFYAKANNVKLDSRGALAATDSSAIERWNYRRCSRDTVAMLPVPGGANEQVVGPGIVIRPFDTNRNPFPATTQWAVADDGTVAIVYPDPYHVEYIASSGTRVRGRNLSIDPVRVSESHKQRWRDEQEKTLSGATMVRRGGTTVTPAPRGIVKIPEPSEWPRFLPPFLEKAVYFDNQGDLWIQRTVPGGDPPSVDVLDRTGKLKAQVRLPHSTRIAGFALGKVYLIRTDADGLETLEQYRWPPAR